MSTDSPTEVGLFQDYLSIRSEKGSPPNTLDEAVEEFREYQRQLAELKEKLQVGLEQGERGESAPLDADDLRRKLREMLAKEGIQ